MIFAKNIFIERKVAIGYEQRGYGYSIAAILFIAYREKITALPHTEKM